MNREDFALFQTKIFQRKMMSVFESYLTNLQSYDIPFPADLGFMKMVDFCESITKEYKPLLAESEKNLDELVKEDLLYLYDHVTYTSAGIDLPAFESNSTGWRNVLHLRFKEAIDKCPEIINTLEQLVNPLAILDENFTDLNKQFIRAITGLSIPKEQCALLYVEIASIIVKNTYTHLMAK